MKKTSNPPISESDETIEAVPSDVDEEVIAEPVVEPVNDDSADKIAELVNDLQRTRADFENFRKQVDAQRIQAMEAARYDTVNKFLPLVDDIERALGTYPDQLAPLRKSFDKTLQSLGITQVDSTIGTEFNPDFHEAVSMEDGDGDIEVIAETLRPGYLYNGNVIRTAMVKVKR